jgi:hypothetical protein
MQLAILPHYRLNVAKQQSVGVASAALTPLDPLVDDIKGRPENIFVQALSTNTAPIIISSTNPAVSGGVGFELAPNANMSLPGNDSTQWFVIAGAAAQKLNITYQAGIL